MESRNQYKNGAKPKSHTSRKTKLKNMKKLVLKMAVVICMVIASSSCSKDGAMGATGAMGAAGANGANGTNGANGINGNANVYGTNSIPVTSGNWTANTTNTVWTTVLDVPQITQSIIDRGTVSVFWYGSSTSASAWIALPVTLSGVSIFYAISLGSVVIAYGAPMGFTISNPGGQTYRVVVITPSNKMAHPNTNWNNYEEVKDALHLVD